MSATLFVHIPKTGGRSVLNALGLPWSSAHLSIADYEKANPNSIGVDAFKFTVVRNPWERVVSMWMFFAHMGMNAKPFGEWLSTHHRRYQSMPKTVRLRPTISQRTFCVDSKGDIRIDQFLRFETLTDDFAAIANKIGATKALPTMGIEEKANTIRQEQDVSNREILADAATDYHSIYNDKLAQMVRDIDGWTADTFGYSFEDDAPALSKRQQDSITAALSAPIRVLPIKTPPVKVSP